MKKLLGTLTILAFVVSFTFAGSQYQLNEDNIQQQFQNAEKVKFSTASTDALALANFASVPKEKTAGGFLLRMLVCGAFIWSHRKYMGTGGESVWYYYCIPVYGAVISCGEFFDVLFGGKSALDKYEGNGSACAWC